LLAHLAKVFSTLGNRNINDPRNVLSLEVVRFSKTFKPRVVVIENVSAFPASPIWQLLKEKFEQLGYSVKSHLLNAFE